MQNSASIIGNILHESVHVGMGAYVLAKWSGGDSKFDVRGYVEEFTAKTTSTTGLQALGGVYTQYARSLSFVLPNGQQNTPLFDSLAKKYEADIPSVGDWLKSYKVEVP